MSTMHCMTMVTPTETISMGRRLQSKLQRASSKLNWRRFCQPSALNWLNPILVRSDARMKAWFSDLFISRPCSCQARFRLLISFSHYLAMWLALMRELSSIDRNTNAICSWLSPKKRENLLYVVKPPPSSLFQSGCCRASEFKRLAWNV